MENFENIYYQIFSFISIISKTKSLVLYSDHRAVAVSIQFSHLPEFDDEVVEPQPSRIDWLKVTAQEREDYYHKSKNLLDQLKVPTEVRHCQNVNCTDEKHLEEIENLYAELTNALLAAASSAIKPTCNKNEGKFNIPGWNSVVKSKHQNCKGRKPSGYG